MLTPPLATGGLVVLVRRASRGSMNVRLTALALLRDLGQLGLNMSGALQSFCVTFIRWQAVACLEHAQSKALVKSCAYDMAWW